RSSRCSSSPASCCSSSSPSPCSCRRGAGRWSRHQLRPRNPLPQLPLPEEPAERASRREPPGIRLRSSQAQGRHGIHGGCDTAQRAQGGSMTTSGASTPHRPALVVIVLALVAAVGLLLGLYGAIFGP